MDADTSQRINWTLNVCKHSICDMHHVQRSRGKFLIRALSVADFPFEAFLYWNSMRYLCMCRVLFEKIAWKASKSFPSGFLRFPLSFLLISVIAYPYGMQLLQPCSYPILFSIRTLVGDAYKFVINTNLRSIIVIFL